MTNDELDEIRRLLLAFEDAATWCEELAEIANELIVTIQQNRPASQDALSEQGDRIAETLRHLDADRQGVARVRTRIGLPPPAV